MRTPLLLLVTLALVVGVLVFFLGQDGVGDEGAGVEPLSDVDVPLALEHDAPHGPVRETTREVLETIPPSDGAAENAPAVGVPCATLIGRVIDERRFPVEGAEVALFLPEVETVSVETGADGRFRFEGVELPAEGNLSGGLLATNGNRAACAYLYVWAASDGYEHDVRDLVLGPASPVPIDVRDGGLPVAGAEVVLEVGFERLRAGRGRTDGSGRITFPTVPAGSRHAAAQLGGRFGRATTRAEEAPGRRLLVELRPTRAVDVVVRDAASHAPVAGATVSVAQRVMPFKTSVSVFDAHVPEVRPLGLPTSKTGADGRVRVVGLPGERVIVRVDASGFEGNRFRGNEQRVEPDDVEVVFELTAPTYRPQVRFPVARGELRVPADGTPVRLRPFDGMSRTVAVSPEVGVVSGGEIVIERVPGANWAAWAETPDGGLARLWAGAGEELGRETSFRKPRTIVARVTDARGDPAQGVGVHARNQGNNPLCEPVLTDAGGVARLTGLWGGLAEVYALAPGDRGIGVGIGSVDLDAGDGEVAGSLPGQVLVRLRILVDGRPSIPARTMVLSSSRRWPITSEDPELGLVEARMTWPAANNALTIHVQATGCLPAPVEITRAVLDAGAPVDVALRSGGTLIARVERPAATRIELQAEREGTDGDWAPASWRTLKFPNADDDGFRFESLEPGRYRVRDKKSGLACEPVDVDPRLGPARVTLDLGLTIRIQGRVVAPEGTDLSLVRVVVEGDGVEVAPESWEREPGIPANSVHTGYGSGTFTLQVPADREVTLRAWHPVLRPAREGGAITLTGSAEEVTLRLEPGPTCSFAVPERGSGWNNKAVHVLAFDGPVGCDPSAEFRAPVSDGRATFGGFEAGTYTLWIDPGRGWAPLVLESIELREDANDLGAPAFTRGSTLRFQFELAEGESAPRIFVYVARQGRCPLLARQINSRGEEEVLLQGLAAGRYAVQWRGMMGADFETREVVLDGEHDEIIEIRP